MCLIGFKLPKTNPNCSGCTVSYGRILKIDKSHNLVKFCRIYPDFIFEMEWSSVLVIFVTTCTTGGSKIVFASGVNFITKLYISHVFSTKFFSSLMYLCISLSNCFFAHF